MKKTRSEFTPKTKAQAFLRCNGKCENKHCGVKLTQSTVNFDHILSDKICRDQGIKSNTIDNCQCLCIPCHKIVTRGDLAEITKRNRQDKRYGEAVGGELEVDFPPVKKKWASRKFDKKPDNYKYRW